MWKKSVQPLTEPATVMQPLVTVLMPVYNGEKHLAPAIESILGQTYGNFELLIMDDGSTDRSGNIVRSFRDQRIRYRKSETNQGIEQTLNEGIRLASGTFIARMDADDISLPQRLALQVAYMERYPETGVLGGAIRYLKQNKPGKIVTPPLSDDEIRVHFLFHNPIFHPAVMFRKKLVEHHAYPLDYRYAEDYRLWTELSDRTIFANIPNMILHYRIHPGQVTKSKSRLSEYNTDRIKADYLNMLFPGLDQNDVALHLDVISRCRKVELQTAGTWLEKLAFLNLQKQVLSHELLLGQLHRPRQVRRRRKMDGQRCTWAHPGRAQRYSCKQKRLPHTPLCSKTRCQH